MAVSRSKINDMYERVLLLSGRAKLRICPPVRAVNLAADGLRAAYGVIQSKSTEQAGFGDSGRRERDREARRGL